MSARVVHFEIPFDDPSRGKEFYRQAFGWDIQDMPEFDYASVATAGAGHQGMPTEPGYINGGMFPRSTTLPSVVVTLGVDSIDDALSTVVDLGGSIVEGRQAIGDMGFAAYFKDPEGNLVGLWENAS